MSCSDQAAGIRSFGPSNVHTKKDGSTWNGFPLSASEPAFNMKTARGAVELRNSSGAIKARVVFRYTEDGITFGSWVPLYTAGTQEQVNDGVNQPDATSDITSGAKRIIQWGAEVLQSSGNALEAGVVAIQIETRSW